MTGNCLLIFLKHYEDDDSLKDDENYGGASMMNLSFLGVKFIMQNIWGNIKIVIQVTWEKNKIYEKK